MIKSVYIHIPFCKSICSYCDFSKFFYNEEWVSNYLDALEKEISNNYKNEVIDTLYIGGGTPNSLDNNFLERLFKILKKINLNKTYEYTIECNIELLSIDQILLFKKYGINRISLGVQTFNKKHLEFLNRHHTKKEVFDKIKLLKKNNLNNINVDLMYAYKNQTLKELKQDLRLFKKLNVPHISTYSLIIEKHTKLYNDKVEYIDEDLDYKMYQTIIKSLKKYNHYETSNFSKKGYESKHNLTYWNNSNYYGFGIGASGYIDNIRYDNTKSYHSYISGNYIKNKDILDKNKTIENEFILGFRKLQGINIIDFKNKYNLDILNIDIVKKLLDEKKLVLCNNYLRIDDKYIYLSNEILVEFLGENYEK